MVKYIIVMSDTNSCPSMDYGIVNNVAELEEHLKLIDNRYSFYDSENIPNFIANHIQDYGSENFGNLIQKMIHQTVPDEYECLVIELTDLALNPANT